MREVCAVRQRTELYVHYINETLIMCQDSDIFF